MYNNIYKQEYVAKLYSVLNLWITKQILIIYFLLSIMLFKLFSDSYIYLTRNTICILIFNWDWTGDVSFYSKSSQIKYIFVIMFAIRTKNIISSQSIIYSRISSRKPFLRKLWRKGYRGNIASLDGYRRFLYSILPNCFSRWSVSEIRNIIKIFLILLFFYLKIFKRFPDWLMFFNMFQLKTLLFINNPPGI